MIRGLIFDFDGLIVDTEGPAYQSWREVYQAHGCDLPLATWAVRIGLGQGGFDPCAFLESQVGRPLDRVAVRQQRNQRKNELAAGLPVLPGVQEYVAAARRLGLPIAVASSSPRAWVADHLERVGLLAEFACIKCGDEVRHAKPDPELYRAVLAVLDLQPTEALALEDSPNGIAAAKAAGLFCVAVPNPLTAQLPLAQADLRLASLADLPLPDLLARVAALQNPK